MKKYLIIVAFLVSLSVFGQENEVRINDVRDSLLTEFGQSDGMKRLEILTNIGDVSLALDDDLTYVRQLWNEALKQQEDGAEGHGSYPRDGVTSDDYVITAGMSLALHFLNVAELDSADVWIQRCELYFTGAKRESNLSYLHLMRDIRDMGEQGKMAQDMVAEYSKFSEKTDPYIRMSVLYKLGVIALSESVVNDKIQMKEWSEYMEEGYGIAKTLPLDESYRFRHQFLLALGYVSTIYIQELFQLQADWNQTPLMIKRPWKSHRSEILACARMLNYGAEIGRERLDEWFGRFCELTSSYPYDCQTPYGFYFYSQAVSYYLFIGDKEKVVECCDSAIANAAIYKFESQSYCDIRGKALASLGRWKEAYQNSLALMSMKDSLAGVSSAEDLMELQTQYDVEKLSFINKSTRQRLHFYITASVLLAISLVLLFMYLIAVRRKDRELVKQIKLSEAVEKKAEEISEEVPETSLSDTEQLFRKIKNLLSDTSIFASSPLRREDIAEMLGTNGTYVAEAIRECASMSVSEYVNSRRLKYARSLMELSPSLSLEEIALKCGFSSRSRFSTAFKAYYKITPGDFIRNC